jgi:hypothetical protein
MPTKSIIPGQHVTKEKLERAKDLRREMTRAEKILWQELRGNKLGVHFSLRDLTPSPSPTGEGGQFPPHLGRVRVGF